MTVTNTLLPVDAMKVIQAMIFIICCLLVSVTMAEANGDLTVNGVIVADDLAIANLDCTAQANGGKLTTDISGMVVCSEDDNSSSGLSALEARMDAAVTSVNGQTGDAVLDTADVPEGTNLYYTDSRADSRVNTQKGATMGIASLDVTGKVPPSQLPSTGINADQLDGIDSTEFALVGEGVRSFAPNNTAGGNSALVNTTSASNNTAFGASGSIGSIKAILPETCIY